MNSHDHFDQTAEDLEYAVYFEPLVVASGFNRDVIAEVVPDGDGTKNGDVVVTSYYVTDALIATAGTAANSANLNTQRMSYSFATKSVMREKTPNDNGRINSGFPDNGRIECITEAYPGLYWQMAPYTEYNALCLRRVTRNKPEGTTGTFKFKTIGAYDKLYFLVANVGSGEAKADDRKLQVNVHYTDSTTATHYFYFVDHSYVLKQMKDTAHNEDGSVKKDESGNILFENPNGGDYLLNADAKVTKYDVSNYLKVAGCHDNFGKYSLNKTGTGAYTIGTQNCNFTYDNPRAYAVACEMSVEKEKLIDRITFQSGIPGTDVGLVIFAVTGKTALISAPVDDLTDEEATTNVELTSFEANWEKVDEAVSYRLDVATDEDFQHMVEGYNNKEIPAADEATIRANVSGLDENTDYYWRVRSVDVEGGQSRSSAPRRVTTLFSAPVTKEIDYSIEDDMAALVGTGSTSLTIHRTLYKDGYFNTICLPFSLTAEEIAVSPLAGCELFEFRSAQKLGDAMLDIKVGRVTAIEAGMPYLIRWSGGEDMSVLVFENVVVTTSTGLRVGTDIEFVGHIGMELIEYENHDNLFLGEANQLYWPINDGTMMKGFRAYFAISNTVSSPVRRGTPARIVVETNTATDVENVLLNNKMTSTAAVSRIEDGQIIILKNGVKYNIIGMELR